MESSAPPAAACSFASFTSQLWHRALVWNPHGFLSQSVIHAFKSINNNTRGAAPRLSQIEMQAAIGYTTARRGSFKTARRFTPSTSLPELRFVASRLLCTSTPEDNATHRCTLPCAHRPVDEQSAQSARPPCRSFSSIQAVGYTNLKHREMRKRSLDFFQNPFATSSCHYTKL